MFFVGMTFHTKTQIKHTLACLDVAATVDLVHNEFRMRTLFLQTKMVVGRKRRHISLPHRNRPFTKVGICSPFIFRSYGSWLLL